VQRLARAGRFRVRSPVGEKFFFSLHLSRSVLGHTQPPIQLVLELFPAGKAAWVGLEHPHRLEPRLNMGRAIPLLSSLCIVCFYTSGAQDFQKHRRQLKIPGARHVSWSKVHKNKPQTLEAHVKVAPPPPSATQHPRFIQPCFPLQHLNLIQSVLRK